MVAPENPLDRVLHRIQHCPACQQLLRMHVDADGVIQLYCFTHGYFEITYARGNYVVEYKFPEAA